MPAAPWLASSCRSRPSVALVPANQSCCWRVSSRPHTTLGTTSRHSSCVSSWNCCITSRNRNSSSRVVYVEFVHSDNQAACSGQPLSGCVFRSHVGTRHASLAVQLQMQRASAGNCTASRAGARMRSSPPGFSWGSCWSARGAGACGCGGAVVSSHHTLSLATYRCTCVQNTGECARARLSTRSITASMPCRYPGPA